MYSHALTVFIRGDLGTTKFYLTAWGPLPAPDQHASPAILADWASMTTSEYRADGLELKWCCEVSSPNSGIRAEVYEKTLFNLLRNIAFCLKDFFDYEFQEIIIAIDSTHFGEAKYWGKSFKPEDFAGMTSTASAIE